MFELTGKLKVKKDEQRISDTFKKREFVVTDNNSNYPQHIKFQLKQDKCRILDDFQIGEDVKVSFFISGREYQNKRDGGLDYFTSLDAWKLEKVEGGNNSSAAPAAEAGSYATETSLPAAEEHDDLPF